MSPWLQPVAICPPESPHASCAAKTMWTAFYLQKGAERCKKYQKVLIQLLISQQQSTTCWLLHGLTLSHKRYRHDGSGPAKQHCGNATCSNWSEHDSQLRTATSQINSWHLTRVPVFRWVSFQPSDVQNLNRCGKRFILLRFIYGGKVTFYLGTNAHIPNMTMQHQQWI